MGFEGFGGFDDVVHAAFEGLDLRLQVVDVLVDVFADLR